MNNSDTEDQKYKSRSLMPNSQTKRYKRNIQFQE